jgi:hypothetical protein
MPTRKEDNDDERQARIDAMVEAHKKLLDRSGQAQTMVRIAQVRARMAQAVAIALRQRKEEPRRRRRRPA